MRISLRSAAGMRFSRECAFYYWAGWLAWWIAGWGALYGEYTWRAPDALSFYLAEAWVALLVPFVGLAVADHVSIAVYQAVWFEFSRRALGPLILESGTVDRIREELGGSLLLRWFRPPPSREVTAQLMTAALWYPALAAPQGASWWRRYGEWGVDVLFGFLPFFASWFLWLLSPARWGLQLALLVGSLGLAVLGYSVIRLAARRQAILDYFTTWRGERPGTTPSGRS